MLLKNISNYLEKSINFINESISSKPVITAMWACINEKNAYNNAHVHQNSHYTGVYYVQAPDNCGEIIFHDPRVQLNALCPALSISSRFYTPRIKHIPKAGQLVIFPGWLLHHVKINQNDEQRIIIGFNFNCT